MSTVYSETLKAFNLVLNQLSSRELAKGINLSNWADQLIGNSVTTFPAIVVVKVDDKEFTINLKAGYTPAEKRQNAAFFQSIDSGQLDKVNHYASVLGYLLVNLFTGKPLSTVNSGRGLIIKRLLALKGLKDVTLTIKGFNVGGNSSPSDTILTLQEIKLIAEFYSLRAKRILDLPTKVGSVREKGRDVTLSFGDVENL